MLYKRVGRSGLKLPTISLGLWYNFGKVDVFENSRAIARRAFDLGITHFDLANNYGPPPGSAEENFGKLMQQDFHPYRDEMIISTKAGWDMWPGPYGEFGSRKYLLASLDQSLKRMGLEYVDIFYSHRPDFETPLEETMGALDTAVRQGKALYVGISSYSPEYTRDAARILRELGTPCIIHQPSYNMFDRWVEDGLLDVLSEEGIGCIVFSPLAQGLLTDRYLDGIPAGARATKTERVLAHPRGCQRQPGEGPQTERDCHAARAKAFANGACLGFKAASSDLSTGGGEQRCTAGRQPRHAEQSQLHRAGIGFDRNHSEIIIGD